MVSMLLFIFFVPMYREKRAKRKATFFKVFFEKC